MTEIKVVEYLYLVNVVMKSYRLRCMHRSRQPSWSRFLEDIYQEGCLGLVEASHSYNDSKGASFETHAYACIRYKILGYLNEKRGDVYVPRHINGHKGFRPIRAEEYEDYKIPPSKPNIEQKVEASKFLDKLSGRELESVEAWLMGDGLPRWGLTRSRASQVFESAIDRMRGEWPGARRKIRDA